MSTANHAKDNVKHVEGKRDSTFKINQMVYRKGRWKKKESSGYREGGEIKRERDYVGVRYIIEAGLREVGDMRALAGLC